MDKDLDRINELYAGQIFGRETQIIARERIHWICRQISGDKVLDIGCSQGIVSLLLGREGFNCIGIDYKKETIDYARKELEKEEEITKKRVSFQVADATQLLFEDGSFDTVILGEVLEHLTHPEKVLKEAYRVLKKGGTVIITAPFGLNPSPDHKRTYYPNALLEQIQNFFKTRQIGRLQNYILYSGEKDAGDAITTASQEALLLERLRLHEIVEERCLSTEQTLYEKTITFNEQIKTLKDQISSLTAQNKDLKDSLERKEKELKNEVLAKESELHRALIEKATEFSDALIKKDNEINELLSAKRKESEEREESLRNTVRGLKYELQKISDGKGEEIDILKKEIEEKEKQHEANSLRLEELKKQLCEKDNELNSLRSGLERMEKRLDSGSLSMGELEKSLSEITVENNSLRDNLEHKERQHAENIDRIKELHAAMLNKKERELNESLLTKLDETKNVLHERDKQLKKAFEENEKLKRQLEAKDPQWQSRFASQEELFRHAWKWRIGSIFVEGYIIARDFIKHPVRFAGESGKRFRDYYYTVNPGAMPKAKNEQQMRMEIAKSARTTEPAISSPKPRPPTSVKLEAGNSLTLGCILDEFTAACFRPECNLVTFRPDNWKELLEAHPPKGIFVESAWRGNEGSWQYRVAKYAKNMGDELLHVLVWAKDKKIPSFFWNKEDPTHFERFVEKAKLFDYVFTTDADCIPGYKKEVGHERVFALPFAAQPQIHNPILERPRENAVCFAGTYYAMFPERCQDMELILKPALDFGLHIYDRQYGLTGPEAAQYRFPDIFQPAIKGRLDYQDMLDAYKNYKVFLNVNSVKNSPTMFSRRVFELLACGTPVITTYSKGIEEILGGDLVLITESEADTGKYLEKLINDTDYWSALSVRGIRKVMEEHTYSERMKFISECIGLNYSVSPLPSFTVISLVENEGDLEKLTASLVRQKYRSFDTVLLTRGELSAALQRTRNALQDIDVRSFPVVSDAAYSDILKSCRGEYIAVFNCKDYYGANYLGDYALSARYAQTSYIGKNAHYSFSKGTLRVSGDEFRFTSEVPTATLAIKKEIIDPVSFPTLLDNARFQTGESKILSLDRFNYIKSAPDSTLPDDQKKKIEV